VRSLTYTWDCNARIGNSRHLFCPLAYSSFQTPFRLFIPSHLHVGVAGDSTALEREPFRRGTSNSYSANADDGPSGATLYIKKARAASQSALSHRLKRRPRVVTCYQFAGVIRKVWTLIRPSLTSVNTPNAGK
jgi:hypothetical protein